MVYSVQYIITLLRIAPRRTGWHRKLSSVFLIRMAPIVF